MVVDSFDRSNLILADESLEQVDTLGLRALGETCVECAHWRLQCRCHSVTSGQVVALVHMHVELRLAGLSLQAFEKSKIYSAILNKCT